MRQNTNSIPIFEIIGEKKTKQNNEALFEMLKTRIILNLNTKYILSN